MPKPSLQPPTPSPGPTAPPTPSRAPLSQFLTRPSKWFARSASAPRVSSPGLSAGGHDDSPRASTSSLAPGGATRKPKISRPTDPRPILDAEGYMGVPGTLSSTSPAPPSPSPSSASSPAHAKSSLDLRYVPPPSPARSQHNIYGGKGNQNPVYGGGNGNGIYGGGGGGAGLGDLRTASRRAWAHSADDLRAVGISAPLVSPPAPPSPTSGSPPSTTDTHPPAHANTLPGLRVNTSISFVDKVAAYRGRSDSTPTSGSESTPQQSGYAPTPLSGGTAYTPSTATSYTHQSTNGSGAMGSFTGAPLTQAPLQMSTSTSAPNQQSPSHSNSLPIQIQMPDPPFYARRRTDSERSARSGKSGLSGKSGTGSPGSTPPSARAGGMAWPAMDGVNGGAGGSGPGGREGRAGEGEEWERGRVAGVDIDISANARGFGPGPGAGGTGWERGQGNMAPGHVHTRSHSFTPKLSSRLASLGGVASPGRKGSVGEVEPAVERDGKEKEKHKVGFPFHFGGGGAAQSKALPHTPNPLEPSPLLSPPHIILEPPAPEGDAPSASTSSNNALQPASATADSTDGKRASQIVYAAGFVNRLVNPALADPRAWKAFRMEVRGTKLVLHKPPGDRAVGVRDLFAVGIVEDPEDEEALAVDEPGVGSSGGGGQRRDAGSMGRKKRAYWGRGRHPGLCVAGAGAGALGSVFSSGEEGKGITKGKIEKGTMEALVHELVFATVFLRADAPPEEAARGEEEWREYALAVLLSLPLLANRARVETEFVRCAGYLVSGASPEEVEAQRARVAWMAGEYLRFHGPPADPAAWEDFRADTIPDVFFSRDAVGSHPALAATPFSPRPDGSVRMVGLLDALGVREPIPPSGLSSRMPWAALEAEGLTRDVLFALDPHVLAHSLTLFHRAVLEQAPDNPTVAFLDSSAGGSCSPLFGSDAAPHWLTKLLLLQILGVDTGSNAALHGGATPGGDQQQQPSSRTHSRSEVISVWARVGELCRAAGDECTWQAIVAALCSAPVARLEKVWRRVEAPAIAAVEGWARLEGEGCEVREPRVTPWGGDIRQRLKDEVDTARVGDVGGAEETLVVAPMERALDMFEGWSKRFLLCPRRVSLPEDEIGEDVKFLVNYWRESFEGRGAGGIAAKFLRVDQFMSLSLAAEPRRKGYFEPHFWTRANNPYTSLLPLAFPETLSDYIRNRNISNVETFSLTLRYPSVATCSSPSGRVPMANPLPDPQDRRRGCPPDLPHLWSPDGVEVALGRAPSVRVKPGSSHLDRKTSIVSRRNSLPSPAQRRTFVASEPSSEPPLRVRVLAGTLNALVDVLVHSLVGVSVSVADDNGEMSLGGTKTRELVVDQEEFSKLWWNVYRSLVTPLVFFELLRKMYLQARPRGAVPSVAELLYVTGKRTEVLDTIKDWLTRGGGAQDVLDDTQLHTAIRTFLDGSAADHLIPQSANASDPGVEQAWSTLIEVRGRLRRTFETNTMRPPAPFPSLTHPSAAMNGRSRPQNQTREPPDIDRIDAEELVDNLDAMACAAFGNVTEEDLFCLSDLLEVQTADRIGWFLSFAPSEETVEIQNMYSYLQEIEPSPLISDLGQDSLYRLLPPSIRSCIRAYVILRKWTISQLVAPRLGLRARQSRMELILRAIEVTRLRAIPNHAASPQAIVDFPCPRSFVEAVLTSAVLSVESRMHTRPWLNIAMGRGTHCDSIASLLSQPATQSLSSSRDLTLDVGWFLERMLEILAAPDVMESLVQQDGHSLINFDKRRHLCNLIVSVRKGMYREDVTRRAFERLNNIEKEVWLLQFDHRGIKDEAQREGASGPGSSPAAARRAVRPFQKTVALQVEKNRRDRTLRTRLHKERVHEQTKNEKREDLLNKAMRKQPVTPQQKHQRSKKSMSAFLHFMRPISSAFGNETVHAPALKRTAEELDFVPSSKPSLVVSLVDARVAQFVNNDRSFTFALDAEDGGKYLFQAVNKREMIKWLETINRVTQTAAKRRLTYLGNPKPQLSDHLHDPVTASRDPLAVFGVDLNFLLRRELGSEEIPPGTIPSIVERCLSEIEARGLMEVGIYRLAGAASTITALKEAFNRGEDPIEPSTDIHAVCDLVKSWFRVLPEPLFPSNDYHLAIDAMQLENLDDRLTSTRNVVQGLPRPNFDLLKRVSEHLDRVADFEEKNQMTAEGLAIVFSPNLLRAPQENFAMILANMAHTHKLVKTLITHFHVIFDEGDVEADGEPEENDEDEEEEAVDAEADAEEPFRSDSPTHLEDVAEDDAENDDDDEEDLPPTITAELDQSPLDFSTLSYTLPST
ncbi:Rho GTPase activating protein 22 [Mycena venus]|uniref:Rho GTPase activating protein 22 n=1 Tax=Mycena venus TaxID=2733690 RepID=A0A8H6YR92_9AGAR|nr:Rho GTPase activating protein 22 [Mycena venus]